jgi:hypothetical protein
MRRFAIAAASVLALAGFGASAAMAAPNPAGTGQPGAFNLTVACGVGNASSQPNGFLTAGFAHAGRVYANPGTTSGALNAVSEYDIACYQTSQTH